MKLTLDSIQWLNEVSPYKAAENNEKSDEVENEADTLSSLLEWSLKPDTVGSCTSCKVSLDFEDRSSVIEHYQSNWHKFNVKRVSRGNAPVNEEEFEDGMQDDGPESAEKEEDDEEIEFWTPSGRSYFNQNDNIYSVPRCILRDGENDVTTNILNRPLDCAIFLLSAGHFAAGIFHGGRLVAHRAFHRYVARAKQGGVQSQYDNAHGNANSAGAALRRYNEAKLREDIVQIVTGWKNVLEKTPLVFIRCATYQKAIFHTNSDVLPKGDKRIRTIPFETRRPTLDEVQSTWEKLKAVESHGTIAEFRKDMRNLFEKHRRVEKNAESKEKKTPEEWRGEDIEEKKRAETMKLARNPER
ncbi:unnamed protein product [Caenorhabditis auriculariae]|uniref:VLRF1 domain-containing protein n=1 Tax=Caenorhabditis auriculariae TaxID=2777116 RepID=A0A8S1GZX4_9PELO|nr:unnamed protein product [Caenorhabditis auriculariae]